MDLSEIRPQIIPYNHRTGDLSIPLSMGSQWNLNGISMVRRRISHTTKFVSVHKPGPIWESQLLTFVSKRCSQNNFSPPSTLDGPPWHGLGHLPNPFSSRSARNPTGGKPIPPTPDFLVKNFKIFDSPSSWHLHRRRRALIEKTLFLTKMFPNRSVLIIFL